MAMPGIGLNLPDGFTCERHALRKYFPVPMKVRGDQRVRREADFTEQCAQAGDE